MRVPSDWKAICLNDISQLVTSGSRNWAQYYSNSGSKFIRMTNLPRDGIYLKLDDLKFVDIKNESADGKRTSLKSGDVLISITAELGKIGWVPDNFGEAFINQHTAVIRLNPDTSESRYIAYMLSSHAMNQKINRLNDSGAKAGLNLPTIRSIPLLLPPLPEQRKIAEILSTWDKAIATMEKLISTSKQQKKSLMQQLLTGKVRLCSPTGKPFSGAWEEVRLGDCAQVTSSKRVLKSDYVESGVPFYRSKEVIMKSNNGNISDLLYISEEQFMTLSNKFGAPQTGDILITAVGSLGVPYLVRKDERFYFKDGNLLWLREIDGFDGEFLIQYLKSESFQRKIVSITGGSSQKALTIVKLVTLTVSFPCLGEQQKIAQVLTAADKEVETLKAKLAHLKQEKKALMQQLLTGKRRVKLETEVEVTS